MSDGSITFDTKLDNKQLEKDLTKLSEQISRQEQKLAKQKAERLPLANQAKEAAAALDDAKYKLLDLQKAQSKNNALMSTGFDPNNPDQFVNSYAQKDEIASAIKEQQKEVDALQKKWDVIIGKVEAYDAKIQSSEVALSQAKSDAGAVAEQLQAVSSGGNAMGEAMNRAGAYMSQFTDRIKSLAKRALVFSVITAGLRQVRDWLWSVIQTDQEASAAMAQLRGALLTMVQPLLSVVIPAFTFFVRILTSVISTIAQLIALLTGKSFAGMKQGAKAANQQAKAIKGVGGAAKEASRYLAGFDDLNVMPDNSSGGGGGGGIGGGSMDAPDFDFGAEKSEEQLRSILTLIELVAAGLLGWKFGTGFLDSIQKAVGFFLVIDGAIRLITEYFDAWQNGLSFENLNVMLASLLEIVLGLYLAMDPMAAAIGLIVGGLALVVLGVKDIIKNGLNLENLMTTISGILLASVGIAALTGSWIPLVIGAIAALLLVITAFFGDTEQLVDGLREILDGFLDFFSGIFSGDIEKACGGIRKIIHGLKDVVFSVIDSAKNAFNSFLDWLDEKTGGKLHGIIEFIKDLFGAGFQFVHDVVETVITSIGNILEGLINFLSGVFTGNWEQAWQGLVDILKGILNAIIGAIGSVVSGIINALNALIRAANKIHFCIPDWVPGLGGKSFGINIPSIPQYQIPYLAKGAVIPPNREFMAVLGDQTHGTNIEAPLETIQEAVAMVMDDMIASNMAGHEATVAVLREILQAVLGIQIGDDVIGRAVERYRQKMAAVRGG